MGACLERCVGHAAEFGHRLTEVFVVMRREVIHDIMNGRIRWERFDVGGEDAREGVPVVIGGALPVNFAGCRIQERQQVGRAIASIIEVLTDRLIGPCRQVRCQTLECLDTGAFVEAEQVVRRVEIKIDDVFHFGEEIRIGYLEVVLPTVGAQGVLQKDSLDGRTADLSAEDFRMCIEIAVGITQ